MVQSRLNLSDNKTDTDVAIILINLERLRAYEQIVKTSMPPDVQALMGHKITAPVKNKKMMIGILKKQLVSHLMYRDLEMNGDL